MGSGIEHYPTAALVFAVSALVRAQRGLAEPAHGDLRSARRLLALLVDFMPWYEIETRIVLARAALSLGDLAAARAFAAEAAQLLARRRTPRHCGHGSGDTPSSTRRPSGGGELRAHEGRGARAPAPAHSPVRPGDRKSSVRVAEHREDSVRAVYRKLDASSRAEAVAHASAAGLLDDAGGLIVAAT